MDNLVGSPLNESLRFLQAKCNKIIKVIKLKGNMSKFGELTIPYVIKSFEDDKYITLFVTYY